MKPSQWWLESLYWCAVSLFQSMHKRRRISLDLMSGLVVVLRLKTSNL